MTAWDLWTWVAVIILVAGSLAVFGWFLADAVRLLRRRRADVDDGHPSKERDA